MKIEKASLNDLSWLVDHDHHISRSNLTISQSLGWITVLKQDVAIVGWYRYSLFWDSIPFLNMLYLLEPYRRQGLGALLMEHWEQEMQTLGYERVMTSTMAEENAQHFYRSLGYVDAGMLLLPEETTELFFYKEIN